jgi:hypothetical protein
VSLAAGVPGPVSGPRGRSSGLAAAHHGHAAEVAQLAHALALVNPGYHLSAGAWAREGELGAPCGGVRYTWLLDGRGEVWLERGYRTQEGDGAPLPDSYQPVALEGQGALREQVRALTAALDGSSIHPALTAPVQAICGRLTARGFQGDVSGELWLLLESGVPCQAWTDSHLAREALAWLVTHYAQIGWSVKGDSGWEPLLPGDQLITTTGAPLRLRGDFRYWSIEDGHAPRAGQLSVGGAVRRLRYLRDTAGGCSPGFDAFRRLNLTWRLTPSQQRHVVAALVGAPSGRHPGPPSHHAPGADPAGDDAAQDEPNRLNSHVLHIEAGQSRTHYHPEVPVGGGRPQSELYFALDRSAYGLRAPAGLTPRLYTWPEVGDWARYETTALPVGTVVFIPPAVAHRGLDAFVNVVTIPGFKPGNEIYVDRAIREQGRGAPYNEAVLSPGEDAPNILVR